ncbi:hypothetical protein HMPREF9069_01925 [Atopobium sp. oral taxon 810 str. F0209]|nr:hypothetical protein HMPREF9069_01925 [Atopobium sp. oral taxon 810 str. F0209]
MNNPIVAVIAPTTIEVAMFVDVCKMEKSAIPCSLQTPQSLAVQHAPRLSVHAVEINCELMAMVTLAATIDLLQRARSGSGQVIVPVSRFRQKIMQLPRRSRALNVIMLLDVGLSLVTMSMICVMTTRPIHIRWHLLGRGVQVRVV